MSLIGASRPQSDGQEKQPKDDFRMDRLIRGLVIDEPTSRVRFDVRHAPGQRSIGLASGRVRQFGAKAFGQRLLGGVGVLR